MEDECSLAQMFSGSPGLSPTAWQPLHSLAQHLPGPVILTSLQTPTLWHPEQSARSLNLPRRHRLLLNSLHLLLRLHFPVPPSPPPTSELKILFSFFLNSVPFA